MLVFLYLAAIVAANWIISVLGPTSSIFTAFALIGLVITTRDRLHDAWGKNLKRNMGALILAGSAISYLLGGGVQQIAIASGVAFLISESVDALVYTLLRQRPWLERVNGSNVVSAAVDSVLFPLLAFGGFLPIVTLGQFAAKVFGGAIWSGVLKPRNVAALTALAALAMPAQAQSVSIGIGEYHNEFVTQEVIEVVVLGPKIAGLTPNLITSWDIHGNGEPVLLPQVGRDLFVNFPVIIGADIGASAGPWDDYGHWEPHGSVRAMAFLPAGLKVITIASWQPFNEWMRGVVVKVDWSAF
jgi:uncharacterized PurR-regulated membrane protein YhhQ (DUF165 family)